MAKITYSKKSDCFILETEKGTDYNFLSILAEAYILRATLDKAIRDCENHKSLESSGI